MAVSPLSVLTGHTASININEDILQSWSQNKRIVDKVHRNTCGNSSYFDIRTILQRKKIWSDDGKHYLGDTNRKYISCIASSTQPQSRKVALGTMNRSVNDVFMIDHL